MEIIRTELKDAEEDDYITVWTDEDPNSGFNFKLDDIKDKADLIKQVEARVKKLKDKKTKKEQNKTKYNTLKKEEI